MVVASEHVLCAEIHEWPNGCTHVRQEERRVVLRHAVGSSCDVHVPYQEESAQQS